MTVIILTPYSVIDALLDQIHWNLKYQWDYLISITIGICVVTGWVEAMFEPDDSAVFTTATDGPAQSWWRVDGRYCKYETFLAEKKGDECLSAVRSYVYC